MANTYPYQKTMISAAMLIIFFVLFSCKKDEDIAMESQPFITDFIGNIKTDSISQKISWLQQNGTRFALSNNRKTIALGIRDKLLAYGYADARLDSFNVSGTYDGSSYNCTQYNVIATLGGAVHPDSLCVVGAHYDCIVDETDPLVAAPGADDNASGVAGMLEIARVMKQQNYSPRTSIVFVAFGCEELDLNGSAALAQQYSSAGTKIGMMLNMDMIGYDKESDAGSWEINIMCYDNSESLRSQAASLAKTYTSLTPENDNQYNTEGDSYSFNQKGYQALFFLSYDDDPYYHTINDLKSNVNVEYCSQVVKLNCSMLLYNNQ
ncbi:MAG: M28 family metallopeptidase [Bacteroidota bacterium]